MGLGRGGGVTVRVAGGRCVDTGRLMQSRHASQSQLSVHRSRTDLSMDGWLPRQRLQYQAELLFTEAMRCSWCGHLRATSAHMQKAQTNEIHSMSEH